MQKRFHWLTGDVNWSDYGGKWVRQVGPRRYHVIELCNMIEACGRDATSTYNVDLSEIDLDEITAENIASATKSCGWDRADVENPLHLVEMLHSYGCKAPLWDGDGNSYAPLMQQARAESRALDSEEAHKAAMQRPANRLGSTAAEMMRVDFRSAMIRGIAEGKPEARIMGKMHGLKETDLDEIAAEPMNKDWGKW